MAYGAVVVEPTTCPSTRKSTLAIVPSVSVAFALIRTVSPVVIAVVAVGAVRLAVGAAFSTGLTGGSIGGSTPEQRSS